MPGMKATMDEWKSGTLHSGSKTGPIVKNQKQAIAIGMNEKRQASQAGPPGSPSGKTVDAWAYDQMKGPKMKTTSSPAVAKSAVKAAAKSGTMAPGKSGDPAGLGQTVKYNTFKGGKQTPVAKAGKRTRDEQGGSSLPPKQGKGKPVHRQKNMAVGDRNQNKKAIIKLPDMFDTPGGEWK